MLNKEEFYKEKSRFLEEIKENFYDYFDNYNQTLNIYYDWKNIFSFTSNWKSLDRGLCYISSQNINIPEDFFKNYWYNEYLVNLIQYNDLKELKSLLSKKYFNLLKIDDYNKLLNKNIDLSNQEKLNLLIDNFIDFWNIFSCLEKSIFVKHFREFWDIESNSLIKDLINFKYEDIEFIK